MQCNTKLLEGCGTPKQYIIYLELKINFLEATEASVPDSLGIEQEDMALLPYSVTFMHIFDKQVDRSR